MKPNPSSAELWNSESVPAWKRALAAYEPIVAAQGVNGLEELDGWVRKELPATIAGRREPYVTRDELVRVTRWKMARGVWRARNLALVTGNDEAEVLSVSREALAAVPEPRNPIQILARLKGVGPATASAVAAAAAPSVYPFFDELVAAQVPGLGKLAFTIGYYGTYADALRNRAAALGGDWTPVDVERALFAFSGGKAGANTTL